MPSLARASQYLLLSRLWTAAQWICQVSALQNSHAFRSPLRLQRLWNCKRGAKTAANRVPNLLSKLDTAWDSHTILVLYSGMQLEAWQMAILATKWASLHQERLQMTDAQQAGQVARAAVAQATSLHLGPSLA